MDIRNIVPLLCLVEIYYQKCPILENYNAHQLSSNDAK